jgi:hypothetical protein
MDKKYFKALGLLLVFLVSACGPKLLVKPYQAEKTAVHYKKSIEDASQPTAKKIDHKLFAITKDNTKLIWKEINGEGYILVSSWKYDTTYYKNDPKTGFYNTGKYTNWVTVSPELKNLCNKKGFGRKVGMDLRLKQLLGMPPTTEKKYFVEFWVRPQDLYRPCPDPEVSDLDCELAFPDGVSEEHKAEIEELRKNSYSNATWDKNYPWTQLGYTYDWNPAKPKNIGLSEFVIGKNKNVVVAGFYSTASYCACTEK